MAELIERQVAIDAVTAVYVRTAGYKTRECVWETREAIQKLPSADVAPVVHGRWIEQEKYTFGVMYDCSICGDRILDNGHSWNYCPNCGARMDGDSDAKEN